MANEIERNIYLVNAPAGSGKTTKIKKLITEHLLSYPEDNILCITYTNRAVDELKKGITNRHVYISTIHSFINNLISPFFSLDKIVELYWDIFGTCIQERINNSEHDEKIEESNKKYIEKYGALTVPILKANIKCISYGETEFTSLYYGKLSHDDLLMFARKVMEKYPNIRKKIFGKYQLIFIDEYQDTSANILNIFYQAVKDTDTKLLFLGDKMQQIYKTYDGSFENIFAKLNTDVALETNHRSITVIVDILNNLYNNPKYKQDVYIKNRDKHPDYNPRIILSDNMHKDIEDNLKNYPDTLVLYLFNRDRFKEIGAAALYGVYDSLERYGFGKKYSPVNVLTDLSEDNPDEMMKFLFTICEMSDYWSKNQYGNMIYLCRRYKKYYDTNINSITKHVHKIMIKNLWGGVFEIFNDSTKSIRDLIDYLVENKIIIESCLSRINPEREYDEVLDVSIGEVKELYNYLKEPHISTQHGVKGESHDTVVFVATDSSRKPFVYMYKFFEVWSTTDFSLNEFEDFYYSYAKLVSDVERKIGTKTRKLNAELHDKYKADLIEYSRKILTDYSSNKLFEKIAKEIYEKYLSNPTSTNAKKCFNDNTVYGVLSAYRLFYVGCSRARKNLTIIVDKAKVSKFSAEFRKKAKSIGFDVLPEEEKIQSD